MLYVTLEPWSHTNMLIGLALQFLGKKIISLDKRFLLLWRFWALYPNTAVAGVGGETSLFLAVFLSLFACCPTMFEGFPSIYFIVFPSAVMVLLSLHQCKGKLRKKASGLWELMSVLLSQCCGSYYRATMLVVTDCVADSVTWVQETVQYFGGCLWLLHIES